MQNFLSKTNENKSNENKITSFLKKDKIYPVYLSKEQIELYYEGYCNDMIWPLFHYFFVYVRHNQMYWQAYQEANNLFLQKALEIARFLNMVAIADDSGLMVDALAMVVGHELGHLVKRHRGYSEISKEEAWRQENEADDFGFRLAKNSGFNPSAALITTYSFFTVLEGTRYGGHYHPPASCRIVELSDKYVLKEENQTGNGRTLATESNGTRERSKFLEALKPLREDCLSTKS